MKIVNGIELLQMIKEGKIKEDTEIKVWFDDGLREFVTTLYFTGIDLRWEPGTFLARHFYSKYIEFEIIEKDKKIKPINICKTGDEYFIDKINELIDVVNELKGKSE